MKICGMYNTSTENNYFCKRQQNHNGGCSPLADFDQQGVSFPPELEDLRGSIAKHSAAIARLRSMEEVLKSSIEVTCIGQNFTFNNGCGQKSRIGDLEYIQTHWYVTPYSCNEGDYWNAGEGQFICPKCGKKNRLYDRPEIERLKASFASIKNVYEK